MAVSRRAFLKSSAATFATISAVAYAQDSTSKPADKILRWGVIGIGHRGRGAHIPAIKSFDQFEILGVCDVMENHLGQAQKSVPRAQPYSDYQKLLANPDINAVLIATPNVVHKEVVLAALQAGKNVMCEKPIATTIEDCHAMKQAAEQSKQVVLYCMQLRYSPIYQELRKQIEAGKIGAPKHLLFAEFRGDWYKGDVWQYTDPATKKSMNWRFSHAASGGTLNEKVCHYFDILSWMVGELPKSVTCDGGISVYNDGRDTWDHASTTLTYPSGATATHSLCMFGPKRLDLQIIGESGSLHILENSIQFQHKSETEEIQTPQEVRHGERGPAREMETAVTRMYQDFLACVQNETKPWMDTDKAIASSKTAWLAELSSQRKLQVNWTDIA